MITLDIDEAAAMVGVSPSTVRTWVMRGALEPVRRGARPLRFDESALARYAASRLTTAEHRRLDTLYDELFASEDIC